jgi:hypothetical protein
MRGVVKESMLKMSARSLSLSSTMISASLFEVPSSERKLQKLRAVLSAQLPASEERISEGNPQWRDTKTFTFVVAFYVVHVSDI